MYGPFINVENRGTDPPSRGTMIEIPERGKHFCFMRSRQIATYLSHLTARLGCAKAAHKSTLGCLSARLSRHRFLFPSRKREQSREFIHLFLLHLYHYRDLLCLLLQCIF
jgi:hypothetical protein